ncbi:zf-HC2 domain-containing protein [Permianibacter sp. IMCC34836]|uniref:zf-HC2 domain-containing protein n=1 Tax=Permianibacter fluminis TaxID=2738515 RepID=UPI001558284B|nr:zf-HC2 domain-containing protein [Permianibacter fluminis]NQD36530.1 zf-HC2 domain-containing protein [Permianibacter fluminis]
MLSCKEVTQRAGDWTDGTLSLKQKLAVRLHLLICVFCRRFLRQYKLAAETTALQACQHDHHEVEKVLKMIDDAPRDQHLP